MNVLGDDAWQQSWVTHSLAFTEFALCATYREPMTYEEERTSNLEAHSKLFYFWLLKTPLDFWARSRMVIFFLFVLLVKIDNFAIPFHFCWFALNSMIHSAFQLRRRFTMWATRAWWVRTSFLGAGTWVATRPTTTPKTSKAAPTQPTSDTMRPSLYQTSF